jgi:uncharacterized protein
MRSIKKSNFLIILLFPLGCILGCSSNSPAPEDFYSKLAAHRAAVDSSMRYDAGSPFHRDTTVAYQGLRWFDPDPKFRFESKLTKFDTASIITILGTKGEERKVVRYGFFTFRYDGKEYRLTVYKFSDEDVKKRGEEMRPYLMVWFTDQTTGNETYDVGRYIEVDPESADPNHLYAIDFNYAYNPYCAYSHLYSCAVPTMDNALDFPVTAGEKKYHE